MPNGISYYTKGPFVGRDPDTVYVRLSNVNDDLRQAQLLCLLQFWVYGDRLFNDDEFIRAAPRGGRYYEVPDDVIAEHKPLRGIRVIVEIFFGEIVLYWKYVDYDIAQKLLSCAVAKHYLNIVFLTNCMTCLHGSRINVVMDTEPPSLQKFLHFVWDDNRNALDDI
jgi:hypothetical protein